MKLATFSGQIPVTKEHPEPGIQYAIDSIARGLLYAMLFLLLVFGRPFAHFHFQIFHRSVFVTEIALAALGALWCLRFSYEKPFRTPLRGPLLMWTIFLAWSCVAYARGLYTEPLFATRKFAQIYYALFIFPVFCWNHDMKYVQQIIRIMFIAGIVVTVIRFFGLLQVHAFAALENPSVAMDMAIEFSLCYEMYLFVKGKYLWLNTPLIFFQLYLIVAGNVRTSWISTLLGSMFLLTLLMKNVERGRSFLLIILIPITFATLVLLHAWSLTPAYALSYAGTRPTAIIPEKPPSLAPVKNNPSIPVPKTTVPPAKPSLPNPHDAAIKSGRSTQLLFNVRGILQSFIPKKDPSYYKQGNANWRRRIWMEMFREVMQNHPWIGMGFGIPFLPHIWMSEHGTFTDQYPLPNVDPHNSHLSILYRTGIIGFILYFSFLISLFQAGLLTISNVSRDLNVRSQLIVCLSYVFLVLVHASFAVVLEGPYMGVPFWVTVGLVLTLIDHNPATIEQPKRVQ